ncbi:hypothetical protein [Nannocystis bainbridge]|uniref:Uncharacterized protein n=1 Tax=Nannocystis bainbridge TaxID=2995303 RepID=A0ABT5E9C4_9BACT|nr:hypothetical protein [Nannocystis bainbridge]MDC0722449.1 hypothetical protein [Nannocystis bainbridge]
MRVRAACRRSCLTGALVLLACSASPPPASDPPPVRAGVPAAPEPAPPESAESPPAPANNPAAIAGPLDYAVIDGGVLVVWSRHDGDASEIVAQRLDPRGQPLAPPRHVLRSEGEIVDLELSHARGHAWIAYVAELDAETASGLLGVIGLAGDLTVSRTHVLDRFTAVALSAWGGSRVRVQAQGPEAAVVASIGDPVICRDRVLRRDRPCPGYHLFGVRGDGFDRVASVGVDGGQADMGRLVDVGAGVLLDVWAWHGGPTHADLYLPRGATAARKPKFRRVACRPPFRRDFDGEALVSWCASDDLEADCQGDPQGCAQIHLVTLADRVLTPRTGQPGVPITGQALRCSGGRPVLDLTWQGGSRRFDPQAPGADLDLRLELGVWTGELGLQIAEDGQLTRLRCGPDDRLARDPEPAAPLDLGAVATPP